MNQLICLFAGMFLLLSSAQAPFAANPEFSRNNKRSTCRTGLPFINLCIRAGLHFSI